MKPSKELVHQWCTQAAGTGLHASDQLVIAAELAAAWGAEQSQDGKRYRWLRSHTGGERLTNSSTGFAFPVSRLGTPKNLMQGSVAQHLDAAIDAAMKGEQQ